MKTAPSNKAKLSSSHEPDTLGIVADLSTAEGLNLVQEIAGQIGDTQLQNMLDMAQSLGKRYFIAANKFGSKGIFCTFGDNDQNLSAAFKMANERMREIGSRTTEWVFAPKACKEQLEKTIAGFKKKKRWAR